MAQHSSSARVLIIADDLTGALDTAGPFAEQGVATKVVADPLESDPATVLDARVVSVNTDSRHLPPGEAARHVQRCARRFSDQRFDFVFKKIDSTLRGNVVSETLALMDVFRRKTALIAPAFPAQGRTVVDGVVHVDGVPLAHTGFARDALSAPPLQPLSEVFGAVVGPERVSAWRQGEALSRPDGGVVIADAGSDDDMSELMNKAADRTNDALLVGSAGLGLVLARRLDGNRRAAPTALTATTAPIVFVVGSRAARSREQVAQLGRQPHTVLLEAPNGIIGEISDAIGAKQIVLLAVEDPEAEIADSVEVARRLAQTGLEISALVGSEAVVVTGGDTAIAVLEASRCAVLDVCGNLMPGIPFSAFQSNGRSIYLVTKAGGFGVRDTLVEIVQCLRRGTTISEELA